MNLPLQVNIPSDFLNAVESRIQDIISNQNVSPDLFEAMVYSTQPGGKLIRPQLVHEFYHLGHSVEKSHHPAVVDCAVAIELIHTYSLVHDDLPSMDNSFLRRGRKTCWSAFNEAKAILVGDALIPLSYEILSNLPDLNDSLKLKIISLISKSIGANGLVAGQMMDLFPHSSNKEDIERMQILKTGVLLGASCATGSILGGREDLREKAYHFGEKLGLLYQLNDDLLDLMCSENDTGKTINNDKKKTTFLSVYGIDTVQEKSSIIKEDLKKMIHEDFDGSNRLLNFVDKIARIQSVPDNKGN